MSYDTFTLSTACSLPAGAGLSFHDRLGPVLSLAGPLGQATVALHGATVLSYRPGAGEGMRDLLWLSPRAEARAGRAIRGGVPLCGPWFGPHATVAAAPTHGLLRTREWSLVRVESLEDGALRAEFALTLQPELPVGWAHCAAARFAVTVGATLGLELSFRNTGRAPFLLSGALHTYFAVSDVSRVRIEGLGEREYLDYTGGGVRRWQGPGPVELREESAHMFYSGTPVRLVDPVWRRVINVNSWGAASTVVWNPWARTAGTMADVGDDWIRFLCLETANIPDVAIPLAPATSHHLGAEFSATDL